MKLRSIGVLAASGVVALAAGIALHAAVAAVQDDGGFPMPKPGPEHAMLAKWAGTWDQSSKMRMSPDAPWEESKGTETNRMGCGGFWLFSDSETTMMGQPMNGHMQLGFDQFKNKFVGTWVDSFGSYLTVMEGTWDEKTKTLTMHSDMLDPMSGKTIKVRMTTEHPAPGQSVFKMFMPGPDGKEFVSMEVGSKLRK